MLTASQALCMPPMCIRAIQRMGLALGLGLGLGLVLGGGASVWADDDTSHKPSAQSQASPAIQQPQQAWPSFQELLKLPDWMSLVVDVTAEPMGGFTPASNPAGGAAWIQQVLIASEFSTGLNKPPEVWRELDHWALNLELTSFNGDPNLNLVLGTTFPLQTAAHPVGLWLTKASLQRSRGTGAFDLKAGLLPLNPGFIENPSLDSYIHSALNNTLNVLIPGLPINPLVAPGAELRWQAGAGSELRFGSYWLDSETALAAMLGVNPRQPDVQGSLQIVQWNLSHLPGRASVAGPISSKQGAIARQLPEPLLQLGAFTTTASSTLYPAAANQGVYGTLTLPAPLPIGLDNRIWIGLHNGFNSNANPYPLFLSGGWLNQGLIPGRPFDVLALGFGRTSFSPQLTPGSHEAVLELNYAISINAQLTLQPVIQWIINPGGGSNGGSSYAGGVQLNLSL